MHTSQARLEAARPVPRPARRAAFPVSDIAAIAAGGALGSAARYLVGLAFGSPARDVFPWATFTINVSGSLLLGLAMIYLLDVWPPRRSLRLFLTTGVLGGYTTFSAYETGILHLIQGHAIALADAYAFTSLIAGVAAIWCGIALGRWLASLHGAGPHGAGLRGAGLRGAGPRGAGRARRDVRSR
jgi:fluoride exporter